LTEFTEFFNRRQESDEGMKGNPESFILPVLSASCFPVQKVGILTGLTDSQDLTDTGAGKAERGSRFAHVKFPAGTVARTGVVLVRLHAEREETRRTVAGD